MRELFYSLHDLFCVILSVIFTVKSLRVSDKQDKIIYLLWSILLLIIV